MIGCSGVVTNVPRKSITYLFFHSLFHQGIFYDPRPRVYANLASLGDRPIQSPAISGGLSAWRREVFQNVHFDLASGFHMLEDIDFSIRVQQQYGPRLYINPRARLEHNFAPTGRDSVGRRESRKIREFITFYRKHRRDSRDTFWLIWLLLGIALSTCACSVRYRTIKPLLGFIDGIAVGLGKA
jgi:GT2 family glycosyltransferase